MGRADRLPGGLLHRTVAALGPWPQYAGPGAVARYGRAARLFLQYRDMAAGGLLHHRAADPRRRGAVPRHRPVRPHLVRLCLAADGMDRPVYAGRALKVTRLNSMP